jgi:hypothetical protein
VEGIGIRIFRKIRKFRRIGLHLYVKNIFLGFLIYLLRVEEDILLHVVLEMVFDIKVSRRSFSWEVACLWHWK